MTDRTMMSIPDVAKRDLPDDAKDNLPVRLAFIEALGLAFVRRVGTTSVLEGQIRLCDWEFQHTTYNMVQDAAREVIRQLCIRNESEEMVLP